MHRLSFIITGTFFIGFFLGQGGYGLPLKMQQEEEPIYHNQRGEFVRIVRVASDRYILKWGDNKYENRSSDTFKVLPSGKLRVVASEKDAIVLTQSCGTLCSVTVILEKRAKARERVFQSGKRAANL